MEQVEEIKEIPKPKPRKKGRSQPLIIQLEPETDGIHYEVLLPNEVIRLKPLMIMLFASIEFEKARNNPEPYIQRAMMESANVWTQIYVAYKEQIPVGYIWYRAEKDLYNDIFVVVEQLFVLPEYKHKTQIIKKLILQMLQFGQRVDMKYLRGDASTVESQKMWESYGLKPSWLALRFDGTVMDFVKYNRIERLFGGKGNGIE